jgi:Tol biopolymer transport system component
VAFVVSSEQDAGVHLIDADGTNERRIADFAGGGSSLRDLRWSPGGTRIGVVHGQSDVWVVNVETGESLFAATNVGNCLMAFLGWSPDSESVYLVPGCALGGI